MGPLISGALVALFLSAIQSNSPKNELVRKKEKAIQQLVAMGENGTKSPLRKIEYFMYDPENKYYHRKGMLADLGAGPKTEISLGNFTYVPHKPYGTVFIGGDFKKVCKIAKL